MNEVVCIGVGFAIGCIFIVVTSLAGSGIASWLNDLKNIVDYDITVKKDRMRLTLKMQCYRWEFKDEQVKCNLVLQLLKEQGWEPERNFHYY